MNPITHTRVFRSQKIDVAQAAKHLLALTNGEANALGLRYRSSLIQRGLAPATINRGWYLGGFPFLGSNRHGVAPRDFK